MHYNDVIMGTIAYQITSLTIVYSTVYSDADQRKHQSSASLVFVQGIPGEFPAQMASNAENVSIWWRHHGARLLLSYQNVTSPCRFQFSDNEHYGVWNHSTICSGADQRKCQSITSLAFVKWIHRWPVVSPHKWYRAHYDVTVMENCMDMSHFGT